MKMHYLAALSGLLLASAPVFADANLDLAKTKQCLSCHSVDKEVHGPAFKKVAAKYKDNAAAEGALVKTVVQGSPDMGGFHWGTMKMPTPGPRPAVSEAEAKQLVGWILSQK